MKKSMMRIASVAALTTVAMLAQGPRGENGFHNGGGGAAPLRPIRLPSWRGRSVS